MTSTFLRAGFAVGLGAICLVGCGRSPATASAGDAAALDADAAPRDAVDAAAVCFPCDARWICGGDVTYIDLEPDADGCHLAELPGDKLIAPNGTITEDGEVLGQAVGSGARVQVSYPDGGQWLFCAGSGTCYRAP